MIERKQKNFAKIAVYAVIHEIYFEQFESLRESLNTNHHDLIEKIRKNDVSDCRSFYCSMGKHVRLLP